MVCFGLSDFSFMWVPPLATQYTRHLLHRLCPCRCSSHRSRSARTCRQCATIRSHAKRQVDFIPLAKYDRRFCHSSTSARHRASWHTCFLLLNTTTRSAQSSCQHIALAGYCRARARHALSVGSERCPTCACCSHVLIRTLSWMTFAQHEPHRCNARRS